MKTLSLTALTVLTFHFAADVAQAQTSPGRPTPNPSDLGSLKGKPEMPAQDLLKKAEHSFDLKKGDEILELDGVKVDPVEGAAKLHTSESKYKEITVRRAGKVIKLKARQ